MTDLDLAKAANLFPTTFGLRAFPGETFRVSKPSSYINDSGQVILYTEILKDGRWLSFAKGTVRELTAEVVKLAVN